jgi:hypothetical protein
LSEVPQAAVLPAAPGETGVLHALLASPPRRVSTSIGISAGVHIALLLLVGTSLYDTGEDDIDIAELAVQLESTEGPNDDFVSVASTPVPLTTDAEVDRSEAPGITETEVTTEATDPDTERVDGALDAALAEATAFAAENAASPPAITTTGESDFKIDIDTESVTTVAAVSMPSTEQAMLEKNILELTQNLLEREATQSEQSWMQQGRPYTAKITRQPAADSTGLEQVIAEIYTEKNGKRMRTTLKMKRLAFSHFTQLVDHWDQMISLHDDVIDGRFHSNTEFLYSFRSEVIPRFFGKVTTSSRTLLPDTMGSPSVRKRKEIFRGGYETMTDRISIGSAITGMKTAAPTDGAEPGTSNDKTFRFSEDTRVIFNPDGSFVWRLANGKGPMHRVEPNGIYTRYLVGERGAKFYVRGTVVGANMVYTPSSIEVEGDLVYANDPRTTLLARDYIALVSGQDIEIAPERITGRGDLHVHGALFARRRFVVSEPERGRGATLYMLGSLTAGTLQETEPRYATKIDYDSRFENIRPPSFPMTKRYEVQKWDGNWEPEETAP